MTRVADKQINSALKGFAEAREGSRRFHPQRIGKFLNPQYCFADWLFRVATKDDKGIFETYGESLHKEFGEKIIRDWLGRPCKRESILKPDGIRSKAALSESAGGAFGGYLVPPELRDDIMTDVSEEAFVRPVAVVVPMASATLQLPYPDALTTTGISGVPTFFGGIQMQFGPEAASIPETAEPKFRQLELRANDLEGYALVSNPMMQDAIGLNAWLNRLFSRSIGWFEDYAFLRGIGVGQPLGVLNSSAAIKVTRNAANTVKYVDLAGMINNLLPYSYLHAIWIITVSAEIQVTQLIDASGKTAWVPNYPNPGHRQGSGPGGNRSTGILFNRPMFVTEKLPALGTLGDVTLFDPSLYVIGDRGALEIAVSDQFAFTKNQCTWRIIERVDGRPTFDKTITSQDQATVVSSIVLLN